MDFPHREGYQARIIHEHFCCNRRSAATTSLRPAGSPLGPSPYCTSTHRVLRAPRAGLATRLSDFATNCHEECGLAGCGKTWLVCFVYLVDLVYLVSFVQPNKQDKPDRPNEQDRLADFFSILLMCGDGSQPRRALVWHPQERQNT